MEPFNVNNKISFKGNFHKAEIYIFNYFSENKR